MTRNNHTVYMLYGAILILLCTPCLGLDQHTTRTASAYKNHMALATAGGLVQVYTFDDVQTTLTPSCYFQNPSNNALSCLSFYTDTSGTYLLALAPEDSLVYILTVEDQETEMVVTSSSSYGPCDATACSWFSNSEMLSIVVGCAGGQLFNLMVDPVTKTIGQVSATDMASPIRALSTCNNDIALALAANSDHATQIIMGTIRLVDTVALWQTATVQSVDLDVIHALSLTCTGDLAYLSVGCTQDPDFNGIRIYEWRSSTSELSLVNVTGNTDPSVSSVASCCDGDSVYIAGGLGLQLATNMYKAEQASNSALFSIQTPIISSLCKKYITWGCCGTRGKKFLVSAIHTTPTIDIYTFNELARELNKVQTLSFDYQFNDLVLYYPDYFGGQPGDHIYMAVLLNTTDRESSSRIEVWHFDGHESAAPQLTLISSHTMTPAAQSIAWWCDIDQSTGQYNPEKQYLAATAFLAAEQRIELTMFRVDNSSTTFESLYTTTTASDAAHAYLTWGCNGNSLALLAYPQSGSSLDIYTIDPQTKACTHTNRQDFAPAIIHSIFSSFGKEFVGFQELIGTETTGILRSYTLQIDQETQETTLLQEHAAHTGCYIPSSIFMCNNGADDVLLVGLTNMQNQNAYTVALYNPYELTLTASAHISTAVNSVGWQCNGNSHMLAINYGNYTQDPTNPLGSSQGYIYAFETVPTVTLYPVMAVPSNIPA